MNILVLLGCFALASCMLGVLGLTRVRKDRRGLQRYERECLLDPLSLPRKQQQQHNNNNTCAVVVATAMRSLARGLISPLLAPLVVVGVEQGPSPATKAAATSADRIREFVLQAALRISGLALLMANQHKLPTAMVGKPNNINGAEQDQHEHASKTHTNKPPQPTTWSEDDNDSFADEQDDSDRTLRVSSTSDNNASDSNGDDADDEDEDETFENPCEQQEADEDIAAKTNAQRVLFDGLQFYNVLSQVGAATVRSVVQQAVFNSIQSAATKRIADQQQASISAIGQRYPDILCLSAPSYMQHTTRADLATALLAVSAAAAALQQQQQSQQQQHCGSMERRLSIKRPDALALAAEDGMEPMHRTPLTSPAASSSQLETASFLQAA